MIVATAGHIDHGKTLLVRRLTGVDTDRLPEEKARGISIDLGFAYGHPDGGPLVGFVDVPGHERFVRNMVAGVCGIDFALLVVAADDGVMPQTIEHVQILDLLGVRRGLAVMTKVDRVDAARQQQVRAQIAALLAGTGLDSLPVVAASAVSGEGMATLATRLREAAEATQARHLPGRHFRLSVDRAFSVEGSGTVVTGTVFSGEAAVGDRLLVSPGGVAARVRRLQVHASDVPGVRAGQRCAINLASVSLSEVARGDWIVSEAAHHPSLRLDARLQLLPGAPVPGPAARVHLHHGCRSTLGRVVPLPDQPLAPGASAWVHLVLDEPLPALHGDRFILRDSAAGRTLGGGVVLDPFASGRRRRSGRNATLGALEQGSAQAVLAALLEAPAGVALEPFERMFNLTAAAAQALREALDVVVIGRGPRTGISRQRHSAWQQACLDCLQSFHTRHPAVQGLRLHALRDQVAPALPLPAFEAFLHAGTGLRGISVRNGVARLAEHDTTHQPGDRDLWASVYPLLRGSGSDIASALVRPQEIAQAARLDPRAVTELLYRRRAAGTVHRVGKDRFCLRTTLAGLAQTAAALAHADPHERFTVGQFRDAIGTGRGLAIEILECLDSVGATLRVGEARRLRNEHLAVLQPASPY
jgi:selenocysteine-specific elongation factor